MPAISIVSDGVAEASRGAFQVGAVEEYLVVSSNMQLVLSPLTTSQSLILAVTTATIDDGFTNIPVPATEPRPLLPALATLLWSSLIIAPGDCSAPRPGLEQVTQLTSGSSQSVVHAPVVGVKTGSAERALHTVARAPPATCLLGRWKSTSCCNCVLLCQFDPINASLPCYPCS